jgi:hypothetical protein
LTKMHTIYFGIVYEKLKKVQDLSVISGSVETYVIDDMTLLFRESTPIKMPVFLITHPLVTMDNKERTRILRFPFILGRDVIYKQIYTDLISSAIARDGFEPPSRGPGPRMIDRYTTGLFPTYCLYHIYLFLA